MRPRRRPILYAIVAFALLLILWVYLEVRPTPSARKVGAEGSSAGSIEEHSGSEVTRPMGLRAYLRAWETSWRSWTSDLDRTDGDALDFSDTPDSSWPRAQRTYEKAAAAYGKQERRLAALSPPGVMRRANVAYVGAVRRQATRFQRLADAFAGSDPAEMEQALEALEGSQMQFDIDGARWERAVIAACRATGVDIPEIVQKKYISNGQRTSA
jgi:hypothetical protein